MTSPHALTPTIRAAIIKAALAFSGATTHTVELYGSRYSAEPGGSWDLGEVRIHLAGGKSYSILAEQVYDAETGGGLEDEFDGAQAATAGIHAASWTFEDAEPWLAVVDLQDAPRLVWRVTTATPIDYNAFIEHPAD